MEEHIREYLETEMYPCSVKEIADYFNKSKEVIKRVLEKMEEQGIVIQSGNRKYDMWVLTEKNGCPSVDEYSNLKTVINNDYANLKGLAEEHIENVKELDGKIKGIYANVLTIMGVFTAVTALVITNAQRAYDISQMQEGIKSIICPILISNISTIVTIVIILFALFKFIKNVLK